MWTYFVLRAYDYFFVVLNSLKPFCLSSEQGLAVIEVHSKCQKQSPGDVR